MTPEAMKTNLTKLHLVEKYSFTRPIVTPEVPALNTFRAVWAVIKDRSAFRTSYVGRVKELMGDRGQVDTGFFHKTHPNSTFPSGICHLWMVLPSINKTRR